jgi:hypothetical protein
MEYRAHRTVRIGPLAGVFAVCAGMLCATPANAEATSVEQAAMLGGRILGAAKACGINAERVRKVSERLLSVMNARADSAAERASAKDHFASALTAGAEQMRFERSKCSEVHVHFSEIEVKLGRAPAADNDPVAVKRGVPALGAVTPGAVSSGTGAIIR